MMKFINREQLYQEIWNTPLVKLAPVYNLTTYEIKKLCDSFLIPLPKVGYWSKVAFGKTVEIAPLPVYDKSKLKVKKSNFSKNNQLIIVKKIEKKMIPNISVKKNLTKPHAVTVKTREGLKRSRTDEYGMKKPWRGGFDLRVSKVNERRALLIIDTLCKWFEKNGIKIYQPFEESTTTEVVIDDQGTRIKIEEKSKLTAKILTERWGNYDYYTREYTPTEQLSLVIDNYCWGCSLRKVWRDGKTSKVEEKLGEFVSALFQHAEHKKQRELQRKVEELERDKRRKEKKYSEACKKLEKQMLDELKAQSNDLKPSWLRPWNLHPLKNLVKEQYKDSNYPVELTNRTHGAERYATELNPLSKGLPTYQKATDIVKLEDME